MIRNYTNCLLEYVVQRNLEKERREMKEMAPINYVRNIYVSIFLSAEWVREDNIIIKFCIHCVIAFTRFDVMTL